MSNERILIVEDEISVARDLQMNLEEMGFTVSSMVSSGDQAIQKIEDEDRPDLVLMDISLQGKKDGIETARIINTRFDLPVIYLTSYVEESVLEKAKSTNPYGYLTKPFKKDELQKVLDLGLYRHRSDKDRRMLVTELKNEIVERNRVERELEMHIRQQRVITFLGYKALRSHNLNDLMNEVVRKVAETLDNEYCKVLELLPDCNELILRAGVGWKEGLVGNATVHTGLDSQSGYTLNSNKPVIVEDLKTETRFSGSPLLLEHNVVSGMSIVIQGPDGPWGVLGTHTTRHVTFTNDDINFLHSVANILANAIVRKRAEEQLIEKATESENAYKELKDFIYTVSHDLKEPLFSIDGYFTRLYENNKDTYDEKEKRYSNRIKANIKLMSDRIHEILEVAKIGLIAYNFQYYASDDIVKDVIKSLEGKIESNNINVLIKHNLPNVSCDEKRMRDVFFNLVTNSIKFMDDDKQRQITIGCDKEGDCYKFFVEDTGIGIRKEYQNNIFKIFSRLKDVEVEGTGVGLVIVKKIIEIHRGKVWVESPIARGKGSRFCFTIPVSR
jgi:signal transduction histidine kinase/DNA-binding response OmpR family regulator